MSSAWYAMRSKPNKEDFLAGQLRAHDLEIYYPVLHVRPVNPRSRKVRPYFPGYLFVHVDLDVTNISDLRWMPGVSGFVSFDGEPASVPDLLIDTLKRQVAQHNETFKKHTKNFRKGDHVVIHDGVFSGYEAVFDRNISGEDRVRVLLNLIQGRKMPVEIEVEKIRRIKRG